MLQPSRKAGASVEHSCCPQARHTLQFRNSRSGLPGWRVEIAAPSHPEFVALVSVVYCPWCGVELEEWRRLQRPRLEVVRDGK